MQDRFANSFDPIPLDRSMAMQAQTSGKLNAKHRELMELQKKAQARLAKTRERFQEGMRDAHEVRSDLEWTQKKVGSLKTKASRKHGKEYSKARARFPSPEN
jgi:chromosome segregation ATPase